MMRSPFSATLFFRDPEAFAARLNGDEPITRFQAGRTRFALVRDPEAIWNVLVDEAESFRVGQWKQRSRRVLWDALNTLDGETHRERRRLIGPALDGGRVAERSGWIAARAERMQAGWTDGAVIVAREHFQRLSLCAAGELLFSSDLEAEAPELAAALTCVDAALPRRLPPHVVPRRRSALRRVRQAVTQLVEERRRDPGQHDDLLSALLGAGLPLSTIRGEVLTMLNAAVAEPPRALEAAWYFLAQSAAAERRLHDELRGSTSRQDRLPYLQAVVKETLRLQPPVRHIDRFARQNAVLANQRFGRRESVIVSPVVTHRDRVRYPDPEVFRPERWLASERSSPMRGAYLPFGAGHHACIGAALGRTIITITLATVARDWRLRLVSRAADPRREPLRFTPVRW